MQAATHGMAAPICGCLIQKVVLKLFPMPGKVNKSPRASEGWKSSEQLAQDLLASPRRIRQELETLRDAIITDMVTSGYTEAEATSIVEENLIGYRQSHGGGRPTLQASPGMTRLLDIKRRDLIPAAESEWTSAHRLRISHFGDSTTLNKKLGELRCQLIAEAIRNGIEPDMAANSVERFYVGLRRPALGPAALHASPTAVELLERRGIIRRREAQVTSETWADREGMSHGTEIGRPGRG